MVTYYLEVTKYVLNATDGKLEGLTKLCLIDVSCQNFHLSLNISFR